MLPYKNRLSFFLFCLFTLLGHSIASGEQLSLKVGGHDLPGFHVDIYNTNQLMATNRDEVPPQIFNYDLSTVVNMQQWRGQKCPIMEEHHPGKRFMLANV